MGADILRSLRGDSVFDLIDSSRLGLIAQAIGSESCLKLF
jgi:hypothetical protein